MKDRISVIVTVFNKEKYIAKCLESIKQQIYKKLEVLIVDDGSTDNSRRIIKKFCNSNTGFRYFFKNNEGVGKARNYGLKYVTSKYLIFLDGDDYIDKDYIYTLIRYKNYDFVASGFKQIKNNRIGFRVAPQEKVVFPNEYAKFLFNKMTFRYMCVCWAKLYKTDIIKKNNLCFESIPIGEDTIFVLDYLTKCQNVKIINYVGYNDSIVKGSLSRRKIGKLRYYNQYLIAFGEKLFHYKYDSNWAFIFMRAIKIELDNSKDTKKDFIYTCMQIINDKEFKHLRIGLLEGKKDIVVFVLLKLKLFILLYLILRL